MPLKRLYIPRTDVHPQLVSRYDDDHLPVAPDHLMAQLLQQHINRGNKRLARMTGRSEPPEHELRAEMHKRMYILENDSVNASRVTTEAGSKLSKRHSRHQSKPVTEAASNSSTSTGGGVSPLDIQAAENGGLTAAKTPTANNTLGLAIE